MADDFEADVSTHHILPVSIPTQEELKKKIKESERELRELNRTANMFARTITGAFAQGVASGKGFDEILKGLYQRVSRLALQTAFKPVENMLTSIFRGIVPAQSPQTTAGLMYPRSECCCMTGRFPDIFPFASGGVIGTPTYFPLSSGGLGLAGEAGPEAILPLTRAANGRLGVAAAGGASPASIVVNIATPDADSFRRSEVYVTGQIARAVARGQRGL